MARKSNKASSRTKVSKTATAHIKHRKQVIKGRGANQFKDLSPGERARLQQIHIRQSQGSRRRS